MVHFYFTILIYKFFNNKNNKPLTFETNCGPALVDGLVVDVVRHLFFLEKRIVRIIYK